MWHLRNYETKRSLRKKYKHCKEQLEYTRKSLSTKSDELETAHSDIDFLRSESSRRLMKLINFVRATICFYRLRLNAYRLSLRSQM